MNTARRVPPLNRLRRIAMLAALLLGSMQFLGWPLLGGSLAGSSLLGLVTLIDPFSAVESMVAARAPAAAPLLSLVPVVGAALLCGRVFCGWICPMDGLFAVTGRLRPRLRPPGKGEGRIALPLAAALLLFAFAVGLPLYAAGFSPLTNLFRLPTAAIGSAQGASGGWAVALCSAAFLALLLILDLAAPRLWCRALCPSGWVYGWFNRVSRLRLGADAAPCTRCHGCDQSCYMGVTIEARLADGEIRDRRCIMCGRCRDACRGQHGPLRLSFQRPSTARESL